MSRLDDFLEASVVLSYTRVGYWARRRHLPKVTESMAGKVVVITGATSGLGEAAAKQLAQLGAKICLVGRSLQKLTQVQASISPSVDIERCDLSLMKDIRQLASRLNERYPAIHVLINNAAVLPPERRETSEGLEVCLATNVLGHFLLTELLLPKLQASAPSRIVNVSSGGMYTTKVDLEDLPYTRTPYSGAKAYARTKRGQVWLTEEWAKRLAGQGVVVNAMHPGWANTPGVKTQLPLFYALTRPWLRTPEQGADTVVWLAASEEAGKVSGEFFLDRVARTKHRMARTQETAAEREAFVRKLESML